jgi:hypothetical protein
MGNLNGTRSLMDTMRTIVKRGLHREFHSSCTSLSGLVRFCRLDQGPIQRIEMGRFQSWSAPEWLFGSAWPGIDLDSVPISPFSYRPRINPHLTRSGMKSLHTRRPCPPTSHVTPRGGQGWRRARWWRGGTRWRCSGAPHLRRPGQQRLPASLWYSTAFPSSLPKP